MSKSKSDVWELLDCRSVSLRWMLHCADSILDKSVSVQLLQLCVWAELQQWVSSSLQIDLKLLIRHTCYSSGQQFPHLEIIWKVLSRLSEENKRRFINFARGQDTLPADDAEFDRTHTLAHQSTFSRWWDQWRCAAPQSWHLFFDIELPMDSGEKICAKNCC